MERGLRPAPLRRGQGLFEWYQFMPAFDAVRQAGNVSAGAVAISVTQRDTAWAMTK